MWDMRKQRKNAVAVIWQAALPPGGLPRAATGVRTKFLLK